MYFYRKVSNWIKAPRYVNSTNYTRLPRVTQLCGYKKLANYIKCNEFWAKKRVFANIKSFFGGKPRVCFINECVLTEFCCTLLKRYSDKSYLDKNTF